MSVCQGAWLFIVAPGAAQEGSGVGGWTGGKGGGGGGRGREELQGSSALDTTENEKATALCATYTMMLYSTFRTGHLCAITVVPSELVLYTLFYNNMRIVKGALSNEALAFACQAVPRSLGEGQSSSKGEM